MQDLRREGQGCEYNHKSQPSGYCSLQLEYALPLRLGLCFFTTSISLVVHKMLRLCKVCYLSLNFWDYMVWWIITMTFFMVWMIFLILYEMKWNIFLFYWWKLNLNSTWFFKMYFRVSYDRPNIAWRRCQYDLWAFNNCTQATKKLWKIQH